MIFPTPSGTRDVLPEEMRELRAISERLLGVFTDAGYGEIYTPAIEYEDVLQLGATGVDPAYRVFDERGNVLALRQDMTVPIARVAATRYEGVEPPFRFCYMAHSYRAVQPHRGQMREFLQAGVELIGAPAPEGTAETLTMIARSLDAIGLADYSIALGSSALLGALLRGFGVDDERHAPVLQELAMRDFVSLGQALLDLGLSPKDERFIADILQTRGGPEVLSDLPGEAEQSVLGLRQVYERLSEDVAGRIVFDLGLNRGLGYYTGAIFEVLHPSLGAPIGGGGRYDDLLARFGRDLPAVGFALGVDMVHLAIAGQEQ
ncbi:MAG TPA: ATP phosphoribosyltransferase regulatory subunit [Baekduia sp.]|nr:ATP phosphoribosyltransferase regulatory subunit [Baekduia sp.]